MLNIKKFIKIFIKKNKLNCLVLGGSYYIGKSYVAACLQKNVYNLYLANRGNHPAPRGTSQIIIDRINQENCAALADVSFDLVIDFSCYTTEMFHNTAVYLQDPYYLFISSGYAELNDPNHPGYDYGKQKKRCEALVADRFSQHLIVRPGYVVGDNDYTDRFEKRGDIELYHFKGTNDVVLQYITVDVLSYSLLNLLKHQESGLVKMGYRS